MSHLLIVLFTLFTYIQSTPESITWNENRKLEWKDFKGVPKPRGPEAAVTASRTAILMKESGKGEIILTITTEFNSNLSWVRTGYELPYLLNHEQLHFDMQELYTRKLKKDLLNANFSMQAVKIEIQNIIINNRKEKLACQLLYDNVAGHVFYSITGPIFNEKGQNDWTTKIRAELASLEDFKDPVIKISVK